MDRHRRKDELGLEIAILENLYHVHLAGTEANNYRSIPPSHTPEPQINLICLYECL